MRTRQLEAVHVSRHSHRRDHEGALRHYRAAASRSVSTPERDQPLLRAGWLDRTRSP